MLNDRLSQLRDALHQPPGVPAWWDVCALLDQWPQQLDLDVALNYIEAHQARWPDHFRVAPHLWAARFLKTPLDPRCQIVRTLVLEHKWFEEATTQALVENLSAAHIGSLELRHITLPSEGQGLLKLLRDTTIDGLTELRVVSVAPRRSTVERSFGDILCEALTHSPGASKLTRLDLSRQDISSRGLRALAESDAFEQLEELVLSANAIDDSGIQALIEAPWLDTLKKLRLPGNDIGDDSAHMLAGCARLGGLVMLDLTSTLISSSGYQAFAASDHLQEPIRLNMLNNVL